MQKTATLLLALLLCSCYTIAQVNLNAGLVAYYPFTGNALDASGNGNNPSAISATLTTDHLGNPNSAYLFNGQSNYIQIPNSASLSPAGPMSIFAYVKPQGFYYGGCHGNAIVDKGQDGSSSKYTIRFSDRLYTNGANCSISGIDSTHENFESARGTASSPSATAYTPYVTKNQWYCLAMVQDSLNEKFYVNGVLVGTTPNPISALTTNTDNLYIGRYQDPGFPYWFNGVIDEVRIYNRVLNIQEVDSLCNLTNALPDTVINKYGAVLNLLPCDNIITVDTAAPFNVGDTVLMIQMKGAVIDTSNTASFGNIINYNGAGNYEFNTIKAKSGNNLTLNFKLQRSYNIPDGKVQIVRVPYFQNYTVSQPHTCMPWNGSKGGVFIINVANTLTLNDKVDVSARGFLGGQPLLSSISNCNRTDYYYPATNNEGGMKGEGIANISAAKLYGRGTLANGAGGGNAHNSGGGGGGNGGVGGLGGNQYPLTGSCPNIIPVIGGIGGRQMNYSTAANKIFLGGGGGSGHANELTDKPGGNGGGIVIIMANNLAGNAQNITSNGGNVIECSSQAVGCANDGHSGGGAGGTVLLSVNNYTSGAGVNAKGGKGADAWVFSSTTFTTGPGGGGAGGAIWYKQATNPAAITPALNGGANGVAIQYNNDPWGSQPGQSGLTLNNLVINNPVDTFSPNQITVNFTDSVISCFTRKLKNLTTTTTSGTASVIWDFGGGSTSVQASPIHTFPGYGSFPVKLVVTDSNGCKDSLTRNVIITYTHFAYAGKDTSTCLGVPVSLSATGGTSYSWSPATGLGTPNAATTSAAPSVSTSYVVTVTNAIGCVDKDTVLVSLSYVHFANAGKDTSTCVGGAITLSAAGGVSYSWSPVNGLGTPNAATTLAAPLIATTYVVTVINAAGCTDKDTVLVSIVPGSGIVASPHDTSICKGKVITLHATGGSSYIWSPALGLSNPNIANPIATFYGSIQYVVTGKDGKGCIASDTVNISEAPGPYVDATSNGSVISCYNGAVQLYASGALSYQWAPGIYANDSTIPSPTVTPPTTTVFTVTGTDAAGCKGYDTITVFAYTESAIYVPNAFTPNGDGLNDVIRPTSFCDFKFQKFEIFNRWGESVFVSYYPNIAWDGTFKGVPAPMDVYCYFVKGKRNSGEMVIFKGNITLIR